MPPRLATAAWVSKLLHMLRSAAAPRTATAGWLAWVAMASMMASTAPLSTHWVARAGVTARLPSAAHPFSATPPCFTWRCMAATTTGTHGVVAARSPLGRRAARLPRAAHPFSMTPTCSGCWLTAAVTASKAPRPEARPWLYAWLHRLPSAAQTLTTVEAFLTCSFSAATAAWSAPAAAAASLAAPLRKTMLPRAAKPDSVTAASPACICSSWQHFSSSPDAAARFLTAGSTTRGATAPRAASATAALSPNTDRVVASRRRAPCFSARDAPTGSSHSILSALQAATWTGAPLDWLPRAWRT